MVSAHAIPAEMTFESFDAFLVSSDAAFSATGSKFVDAVLVCVHDKMHAIAVTALAKRGYHILCEKPMATTPEECIEMAEAVKRSGKVFGVGHGK